MACLSYPWNSNSNEDLKWYDAVVALLNSGVGDSVQQVRITGVSKDDFGKQFGQTFEAWQDHLEWTLTENCTPHERHSHNCIVLTWETDESDIIVKLCPGCAERERGLFFLRPPAMRSGTQSSMLGVHTYRQRAAESKVQWPQQSVEEARVANDFHIVLPVQSGHDCKYGEPIGEESDIMVFKGLNKEPVTLKKIVQYFKKYLEQLLNHETALEVPPSLLLGVHDKGWVCGFSIASLGRKVKGKLRTQLNDAALGIFPPLRESSVEVFTQNVLNHPSGNPHYVVRIVMHRHPTDSEEMNTLFYSRKDWLRASIYEEDENKILFLSPISAWWVMRADDRSVLRQSYGVNWTLLRLGNCEDCEAEPITGLEGSSFQHIGSADALTKFEGAMHELAYNLASSGYMEPIRIVIFVSNDFATCARKERELVLRGVQTTLARISEDGHKNGIDDMAVLVVGESLKCGAIAQEVAFHCCLPVIDVISQRTFQPHTKDHQNSSGGKMRHRFTSCFENINDVLHNIDNNPSNEEKRKIADQFYLRRDAQYRWHAIKWKMVFPRTEITKFLERFSRTPSSVVTVGARSRQKGGGASIGRDILAASLVSSRDPYVVIRARNDFRGSHKGAWDYLMATYRKSGNRIILCCGSQSARYWKEHQPENTTVLCTCCAPSRCTISLDIHLTDQELEHFCGILQILKPQHSIVLQRYLDIAKRTAPRHLNRHMVVALLTGIQGRTPTSNKFAEAAWEEGGEAERKLLTVLSFICFYGGWKSTYKNIPLYALQGLAKRFSVQFPSGFKSSFRSIVHPGPNFGWHVIHPLVAQSALQCASHDPVSSVGDMQKLIADAWIIQAELTNQHFEDAVHGLLCARHRGSRFSLLIQSLCQIQELKMNDVECIVGGFLTPRKAISSQEEQMHDRIFVRVEVMRSRLARIRFHDNYLSHQLARKMLKFAEEREWLKSLTFMCGSNYANALFHADDPDGALSQLEKIWKNGGK